MIIQILEHFIGWRLIRLLYRSQERFDELLVHLW
jgi:hypothetical protein